MGVITVGELSSDAATAIARVEAGETLEITRDGTAVAQLRPPVTLPVRDERWRAAAARLKILMDNGMDLRGGRVTHEDKYGDAAL